jgi:SM-20-related protein
MLQPAMGAGVDAAESSAAAAPDPPFQINPDLDLDELSAAYAKDGRVRIFGLLSEGAIPLYECLDARPDWIHLINTDDAVLELDPAGRARLSAAEWRAIADRAHHRARTGFQYRYQGLRVPDEDEIVEDDLLRAFARFMQGDPMIDLLKRVTGHEGLAFTDGQATAYGPGDFLTGHDDDVSGKARTAAYVFGLTPGWRLEWGGLLLFHGPHDRTAAGLAPRFNTLDLFKVPQMHSVSEVTGAAPHRRYAITGWLRAGRPD